MGVFVYRGPLAPDNPMFRGRKAEIARLSRLCNGELDSYAIVYGGRQNGKTSLLLKLESILPADTVSCLIDFQTVPGATTSRVYSHIVQRLATNLGISASPVSDEIGMIAFLSAIAGRAEINRLVLFLEELGTLPPESRQSLANVLRSMFTGRHTIYRPLAKLVVVLAGGIELYDLAATEVSTLHNICEEIHLSDLDTLEAVDLIVDGLTTMHVPHDHGLQFGQMIHTYAGGHPYITQFLGGYLAETLIAGEVLTAAHIDRAAVEFLHSNSLLRHLRRGLDENHLLEASRKLLHGKTRFSRMDEEMARLELLGLACEMDGCWGIRNLMLARALEEWTNVEQNYQVDPDERRHLEALRRDHQRRLRVLQQQAAQFGLNASPNIIIEIEDIQVKIAEIDQQLGKS